MGKINYSYGSRPRRNYTYIDFVRHLAPNLPKNDLVFFWKESLNWRKENDIPLELFQKICHWKSQRPYNKWVANISKKRVSDCWRNVLRCLKEYNIKGALNELEELPGVRIPTASALLTAYDSNRFGIVDKRTLSVLAEKNYEKSINTKDYIDFINKLTDLKNAYLELANCSLRQIEFAIWHYYPIWWQGKKAINYGWGRNPTMKNEFIKNVRL